MSRSFDDIEAFRRAQRAPTVRTSDDTARRADRVEDILSVFDRTFSRREEREVPDASRSEGNHSLIEGVVQPLFDAIDRLRTRLALAPDPAAIRIGQLC